MSSICYYITSHGFGHATRSSQIISALLDLTPTTTITICTLAPTHLFPSSPRLTFRSFPLDSPIIQPFPYEIDVLASFDALETYFEKTFPGNSASLSDNIVEKSKNGWMRQETEFLNGNAFDILISDACWSIGLVNYHSLPNGKKPIKVLLTNFTFDLIYETLFTKHLPSSPLVPFSKSQKYLNQLNSIKTAYTNFEYLIRLPGFVDFPFLHEKRCKTKVLEAPLVYRTPDGSIKKDVLKDLGVTEECWDWDVVLIQFGGHIFGASSLITPTLPPNWICLLPTPPNSDSPLPAPFYTYNPTVHLPTLVGISTVVLGKLGYGTVSECVGMGKPLIYVRREMFAEEEGLLKLLKSEGIGLEMGRRELETGEWRKHIEEIVNLERGKILGCPDGSGIVGKIIKRILTDENSD